MHIVSILVRQNLLAQKLFPPKFTFNFITYSLYILEILASLTILIFREICSMLILNVNLIDVEQIINGKGLEYRLNE